MVILKGLIGLIVLPLHLCFASENVNGFLRPEEVNALPLRSAERSVLKLQLGPVMHGTAFAISKDVLVTNVHNMTSCLSDHGMLESGYDGSQGPLGCGSFAVLDSEVSSTKKVQLLGASPRYNHHGMDLAILRVPGLNANPVPLSSAGLRMNEPVFVVGYPGRTYRSQSALKEKLDALGEALELVSESQEKISALVPQILSSEDIFKVWVHDFSLIQQKVFWSSSLLRSLVGESWKPLRAWKSQDAGQYQAAFNDFFEILKRKINLRYRLVMEAYIKARPDYRDADNQLRVTGGVSYKQTEPGVVLLKGDATRGSSGSLVVDTHGSAVGLLFGLQALEVDSDETCLLDAKLTNYESIYFQYCPAFGPAVISSHAILEKLDEWGVEFE